MARNSCNEALAPIRRYNSERTLLMPMTKQSRDSTRVSTHPLENGERICESTQSINQLMGDLEQRVWNASRLIASAPRIPISQLIIIIVFRLENRRYYQACVGRDIDIDICLRKGTSVYPLRCLLEDRQRREQRLEYLARSIKILLSERSKGKDLIMQKRISYVLILG